MLMNKSLSQQACTPCSTDIKPLSAQEAADLLNQLDQQWSIEHDATWLTENFTFKNFHQTTNDDE